MRTLLDNPGHRWRRCYHDGSFDGVNHLINRRIGFYAHYFAVKRAYRVNLPRVTELTQIPYYAVAQPEPLSQRAEYSYGVRFKKSLEVASILFRFHSCPLPKIWVGWSPDLSGLQATPMNTV